MKRARLFSIIVLTAFCLTALTGCSSLLRKLSGPTEDDAKAYVKAALDQMCRGTYDDSSVTITDDFDPDALKQSLIEGLEEALEDAGASASGDFMERYSDAIVEAMRGARYDVTGAAKTDNGFTVLVEVEPISVTHCMSDRELAYPRMLSVLQQINDGVPQDEALEQYYTALVELIELSVKDPVYGEKTTCTVRVFQNGDGILDLDEADAEALGEALIDESDDDWAAIDVFWDEADAELTAALSMAPEEVKVLQGDFTDGGWENAWFGVGITEADGWVMDPDYVYSEQDAIFAYYDGDTREEQMAAALDETELVDVLSADKDDPAMTLEGYLFTAASDARDEAEALETFRGIYADEGAEYATCTVAGVTHDCLDFEQDYDGTTLYQRLFILEKEGRFLLVTMQALDGDALADTDPFYALDGAAPLAVPKTSSAAADDDIILTDGSHSIAVRVPDGEAPDTVEEDYLFCARETDADLEYTYYSFWLYETEDELIEDLVDYYYDMIDEDEDYSGLTRNDIRTATVDGTDYSYITFDYTLYEQYPCRDLYILYPFDGQYFLVERDRVVEDSADAFPDPEADLAAVVQSVREA